MSNKISEIIYSLKSENIKYLIENNVLTMI